MQSDKPQPVKKGRGPGRPFPKGVSGNKLGTPTVPLGLIEWCKLSYPDALKRIKECLADPDGRVALKAAELILGRAVQSGVVKALPDAPETQEQRLAAADAHLLRLGLAGETSALRAYLAAHDPRYRPAAEQEPEGKADAIAFVPPAQGNPPGGGA